MGPKDIDVVVHEDKASLKLKKTTRDMSGKYQIKMSNAQGETIKEIMVNIQGKHSSNLHPDVNESSSWFSFFF